MRSAAAPLTCGAAIEVPLISLYPLESEYGFPERGTVELMYTPGAHISGLMDDFEAVPLELKLARLPLPSIAPTEIAFSAIAGEPTVPKDGPSFPAAATTTTPLSTAAFTA